MIKHPCYLKGIIRNQGKGRYGMGVELFRLDAAKEEDVELTEEETEAIGDEDQSSVAIMRLYENIGEDFWTGGGITAAGFAEQLDELGAIKKLNLHINCLGGDTHTAQAIYNILADHRSRKTSYIDGIAASAATIVACGANEVVARRNTNYMIHNPWTIAIGNASDLRSAAETLEKITDPIVAVYKQQVRGKIDEEKIRGLMDAETWMTAEEACEHGFVDRVSGKVKALASTLAGRVLINGKIYNLGKYQYKNAPKYPKVKDEDKPAARITTTISYEDKKLKEEGKPMTIDEIKNQYPDLYGSIRQEAMVAERTRLTALDAMKGPGLEDLIDKAKADGKQPGDIAMEAFNITKGSLLQQTQLNAVQRDAAKASGVPAGDAPITKPTVESKKDKGVKLLTAAQKELNADRMKRFRIPVNNGN